MKELPWALVLTGVGLVLGGMLCGVSGLAFAIGIYLPLATMAPLYIGGCVRALAERGGKPETEQDSGVLAASGLVAGEALVGVLIALLVALEVVSKEAKAVLSPALGTLAGLLAIGLVCLFLYRAARAAR